MPGLDRAARARQLIMVLRLAAWYSLSCINNASVHWAGSALSVRRRLFVTFINLRQRLPLTINVHQ
jgi:hypothetical protein